MRGNRDIFSGKSIYNRETISRQEHRISEYRIKISSSSYRAGSTDIPDPLSPLLPIVHRPR